VLGAIHTWAVSGAPRLDRLVPWFGSEGDPVLLEGAGFGAGALRLDFAGRPTWAVVLDDRLAVAVVPAGARPGPVTVRRQGLRSNSLCFGGPSDETPTRFVRVDPQDGATGVFRDTPVVGRLNQQVDPDSLTCETFRVEDVEGRIPARLRLSPDGMVVIWQAVRPLLPGIQHFVSCSGLKDLRGLLVTPHLSRFVPCGLARVDLVG
jgi:hypothetical protein